MLQQEDGKPNPMIAYTRLRTRTITLHRWLLAIVTGFALWFPMAMWAAEAESAPASESQPNEAGIEESADSEPPDPASDVFIPTEEISEDFAVPFPVDI